MKDLNQQVGDAVKDFRERKGMTFREVANQCGSLYPHRINQIEKGKSASIRTLEKNVEAMGGKVEIKITADEPNPNSAETTYLSKPERKEVGDSDFSEVNLNSLILPEIDQEMTELLDQISGLCERVSYLASVKKSYEILSSYTFEEYAACHPDEPEAYDVEEVEQGSLDLNSLSTLEKPLIQNKEQAKTKNEWEEIVTPELLLRTGLNPGDVVESGKLMDLIGDLVDLSEGDLERLYRQGMLAWRMNLGRALAELSKKGVLYKGTGYYWRKRYQIPKALQNKPLLPIDGPGLAEVTVQEYEPLKGRSELSTESTPNIAAEILEVNSPDQLPQREEN